MDCSETAFGTILPRRDSPASTSSHSIFFRVACQRRPYALSVDFGRFGLDVSEQASCLIFAAIHLAQKPAQAVLVADQISIVTSSREFLCLETEIECLPLATEAKLQIGQLTLFC